MKQILKIIVLILLGLTINSCSNDTLTKQSDNNQPSRIKDENREIKILLQNLDKDGLIEKVKTSNPEAIIALATFEDKSAIPYYINFLSSKNNELVKSVAFALSKANDDYYVERLITILKNSNLSADVEAEIILALGKLGGKNALQAVTQVSPGSEAALLNAQGEAFYFFAAKGFYSNEMIDKTFRILNSSIDEKYKISYTFWFKTNLQLNLNQYTDVVINQINSGKNDQYKANLILAFRFIHSQKAFNFLKSLLQEKSVPRKCAAIKSLYSYDYSQTSSLLTKYTKSDNYDIAVTAANYFLFHGKSRDGNYYFTLSKQIKNWKARTIMLQAALKYSSDKRKIANSIKSGYNASENPYEKAALLYALSEDLNNYKFIIDRTLTTSDKIISTTGITSVLKMRQSKYFDYFATKLKEDKHIDLYDEFTMFFKEAMMKNDNALIYYSALAWNSFLKDQNTAFLNTYFFNQALSSLKLPEDIKAYTELCKAMQNFTGQECKQNLEINNNLDWKKVFSVTDDLKAVIKTTKGKFVISLDVKNAPVTSFVFINLARNGYYHNMPVYKRVPCSLVSLGGRRGDGWPDKNIPLVKENLQSEFKTATVGMNSINELFSSVNWFITLEDRPDLNSNYTIFGHVTDGMDVVKKLSPGDKIVEIIIK